MALPRMQSEWSMALARSADGTANGRDTGATLGPPRSMPRSAGAVIALTIHVRTRKQGHMTAPEKNYLQRRGTPFLSFIADRRMNRRVSLCDSRWIIIMRVDIGNFGDGCGVVNPARILLQGNSCQRKLKSPYHDGTTHVVMSPLERIQRLAALVPRPRLHLIRFHGVLAPNARLRPEIIPTVPVNAHPTSADCPIRAVWRAGSRRSWSPRLAVLPRSSSMPRANRGNATSTSG